VKQSRLLPLAVLAVLFPLELRAMCVPIPCRGCDLAWTGERNLIVMDRAAGRIRMIPDIALRGMSPDFALVVPTPTLPELEVAPGQLWSDLRLATEPPASERDNVGLSCMVTYNPSWSPVPAGDVFVHLDRRIGGLHARVISSDSPDALVEWLTTEGFALRPEDATRFAPYVARGFFFTTMRPDRTDPANVMPPGGWNASVNPVEIRWQANDVEVPLPLLAIGMTAWSPMSFDVVDEHRMELAEFETRYANRIDARELAAFRTRYPALATYLGAGKWITSMRRTFFDPDRQMAQDLPLEPAPEDEEFLPLPQARGGGLGVDAVLLSLGIWAARRRGRRQ
jgi:Uncharacterized protein conserved in bacteria (DUF2330)